MSSLLWLLLIGLVAGLLARALVPGKDAMGWPATLPLGVAGSLVGGLLLGLLTGGLRDRGSGPAGLVGSVVGAVILLVGYNWLAARHRLRRGAGPGPA
ncbi:GlsB/YeaQ/YmgE family stress response membrane protein [Geodermatophilus sp. SYSU D01036]